MKVESELAKYVCLYSVREVVMDAPVIIPTAQEDYLIQTPGMMPDVLIPMEEMGNKLYLDKVPCAIWVKVDVPADMKPGNYPVTIRMQCDRPGGAHIETLEQTMEISVIPAVMPQQRLIYTRWMYLDYLNYLRLPKCRFHDLRHLCASIMLMQGVNVKVCSAHHGHRDISTTLNIYSHVLPSVAKEAAQKIGALVYEAG